MAQVIVTHDQADFDAFASQVAARKLYPGAVIVTGNGVGREVHPYLALHRDRFALVSHRDVSWDEVDQLILVDVRCASRLGHVAPLLARARRDPRDVTVHIYDHHAARPDDVVGQHEQIEVIGSTTTLLVEHLERRGVTLEPVEATLLALGIHADTGSLTFVNTTPRDVAALGWLMQQGVQLGVLNRYLHAPFDVDQRRATAGLITHADEQVVRGLHVGVTVVELDSDFSGLDEVTTRSLEMLGFHALFALFARRPDKVTVVARCRTPLFDVGAVVSELGGGGHPSAASASLRGEDVATLRERIVDLVREQTPSVTCVADLMSSPVLTVSLETPLSQIERLLDQHHHSGVCVLDGERLVGVLSRRDLHRARRAGEFHLMAKSYASRQVVVIEPDAALETALERLEKHDIGRLPVLRGDRLIGIVTRRDVISALYQG